MRQVTEPEAAEREPARRRRGFWLPATIAMIVLVGIGTAVGAGDLNHSRPATLDGRNVASQLSSGIKTEQNLSQLPTVVCPATEPSRQGFRFTCTLTKGHARQTVDVVEVNGFGGLQWQIGPSSPG